MDEFATLGGLFLTAFLAATIFPAQSEILLGALHMTGTHAPAMLVTVATAGNVLGSAVNWLLGRYLIHFQDRRWFPVKRPLIDRATAWYQKWGFWSLLLAWVPFIGIRLRLSRASCARTSGCSCCSSPSARQPVTSSSWPQSESLTVLPD